MPELPEVETVVRGLRRSGICGKRIEGARVGWSRTLSGMTPDRFSAAICGVSVVKITRRAKYIVMQLSSGSCLLIHLRMTGSLRVTAADAPKDPYERVALLFADERELRFRDTRKFGRWYLVADANEVLGRLGPEPLSGVFSVDAFASMLATHRRMLKPLLLDQTFLAGLGNIYVDEALFTARLHPCRIANTLQLDEISYLYDAIRAVLQLGIARMGTSLGAGAVNFYSVAGRRGRNQDALQVFRRDGLPCPVCGNVIARIVVGQRSTHVCKHCQPLPRRALRPRAAQKS
ncbi:MAG: bifunctional DNA-formamidopyrimidine glycosylase/DNA-(apurinic or apyrimidinic site) lyase [Kiritimatiellia bacterium]